MPSYLTQILLDFSEDPVSDTTPTWQDVTSDLVTIEWWAGIDSEGDEPQPGGAMIRMKNTNRRWEPDYVAGMFYPNITTQRRFRLRLNDGAGLTSEGIFYITGIEIDFPADTDYSEVTFTCGDGCEVLALDDIEQMDPPDASTYSDVVEFDEPWGYWRLGEEEGTRARARVLVEKATVRHKGKKTRRRIKHREGTLYRTKAEAGSVSGPSGVYKNLPALGAEGAILGDSDTAVSFDGVNDYVRISVDQSDLVDRNKLTAECWFATSTAGCLVAGPNVGAISNNAWELTTSNGDVTFIVRFTGGSSFSQTVSGTLDDNAWHHAVGTWDGTTLNIYTDGVLGVSGTSSGDMRQGDANGFLYIGQDSTSNDFFLGSLDEVAVYEKALTAERVLAHYEAGSARGWAMQTAGERIADIATHALWSEAAIQTSGLDVQPQFKRGQPRLDEISELAHAEGPQTMFFFEGDGDPVYLGYDWKGTAAAYNTTQATFGDGAGEIPMDALELVYDNEVYNDVTATHESGDLVNVTDSTSISERGRRANTDYTDVLLMHHTDVIYLANHVLSVYQEPALRPVSLTVNGSKAKAQILNLEIGHQIRVKRRGEGGTAIDRIVNIIGKRKLLTVDRHLICTYNLSRGFNASLAEWQLGVNGYGELGSTTVLA